MKADHKKHCTCLTCFGTSGWTFERQWRWFFNMGNRALIVKQAKQYRPEK